jgi:hypothetical protein
MRNMIIVYLTAISILSCKKQDYKTSLLTPSNVIGSEWDKTVAKVAGITNHLLKQQTFRNYFKTEVLKTFDGDYDVLLRKVVKDLKNLAPNRTDRTNSALIVYDPEQIAYLEVVGTEYPQMQLSVQTDPDAWNTTTYIPPVVYTDALYDEATTMFVPVVDDNGNTISQLDAQIEPQYPVVIVSENERTLVTPDGDVVLSEPESAYDGISYFVLQPDSLLPIDPNQSLQWFRQNYKYESVYALRYDDLGKVEGWPAGGPETRIFTYNADDPQGISYKKDGWDHGAKWAKRKNIKDKWFVFETDPVNCHLWRWNQTGTTIKYAFYEEDIVPLSKAHVDSLANFVTQITDSSATGIIIASAIKLVGLFLPKNSKMSEFIGELEISANNNALEFRKGTGGFAWRTKPF